MPISDPSVAARRRAAADLEREQAQRQARWEYLKPLIMLVVCGGTLITMRMLAADEGTIRPIIAAAAYAIMFLISLFFGVAGLWVCSRLWLGGVGPLGLGILRLAAIYVASDLVGYLTADLSFMSLFIQLVVYVALLAWLFELEPTESAIVAVITFVLKVAATLILAGLVLAIVSA